MRDQKEVWEQEHASPSMFTRMHAEKPSGPVVDFVEFLARQRNLNEIALLDIGVGKGRNALYTASQGLDVVGVDFSEFAIKEARNRATRMGITNIHFEKMDLSNLWPFLAANFDAIIDCNVTICIPEAGRKTAIKEALRVLKPGGYYLFYGVARTDFVEKSPGPEPNSAIFPETGKFEKQYSKQELLDAYKSFTVDSFEEIPGGDIIKRKKVDYLMWVARFRKPLVEFENRLP